MALFNLLRAPLFILPMLVSVGVAATASLGRVKKFLVAREIKSIDMQQEMREKQINNIDLARLRSAPKELRNGAEVEVNLYTWMRLCRLESFTTFRSVLALLHGILIVKHLSFTTSILLFLKVLNGLTDNCQCASRFHRKVVDDCWSRGIGKVVAFGRFVRRNALAFGKC